MSWSRWGQCGAQLTKASYPLGRPPETRWTQKTPWALAEQDLLTEDFRFVLGPPSLWWPPAWTLLTPST